MRRHLDRPVDTAWWAPLATNGTFGPQVCPQLLPGGFAAASWLQCNSGTPCWATAYDDGTRRRRFIKLFTEGKYDIATIAMQTPNGSILWNVTIRERKGMNNWRVGAREYAAE